MRSRSWAIILATVVKLCCVASAAAVCSLAAEVNEQIGVSTRYPYADGANTQEKTADTYERMSDATQAHSLREARTVRIDRVMAIAMLCAAQI
jgi:hypothetical protein